MDWSKPWVGSNEQVQAVANLLGTSFIQNQPLTGPYSYDPASNNLWVNNKGQSAALLYGNIQRYGESEAKRMYQEENRVNAVAPVYAIDQGKGQPMVNPIQPIVSNTPTTPITVPTTQSPTSGVNSNLNMNSMVNEVEEERNFGPILLIGGAVALYLLFKR